MRSNRDVDRKSAVARPGEQLSNHVQSGNGIQTPFSRKRFSRVGRLPQPLPSTRSKGQVRITNGNVINAIHLLVWLQYVNEIMVFPIIIHRWTADQLLDHSFTKVYVEPDWTVGSPLLQSILWRYIVRTKLVISWPDNALRTHKASCILTGHCPSYARS